MAKANACLLLALMVLSSTLVWGACTDPAAPGVNWRRCYHDGLVMVGVNLEGALLRDATFQRSDLSQANLTEADGFRAKFVSTEMSGVTLDQARLFEADFTRANLSSASLREADLRWAKMVGTNLREADLTGAMLQHTDLRNADLSGARWIDGEHICAPSSLGQCN